MANRKSSALEDAHNELVSGKGSWLKYVMSMDDDIKGAYIIFCKERHLGHDDSSARFFLSSIAASVEF